ncbi:MAG: hypothetical protein Ct9H300mP15_24540 [Gemmatimonadota bacterium]|nr:MAG: hypothetical protein Ct9H300mP15_24540 [Gemmatimonadota bacterium]
MDPTDRTPASGIYSSFRSQTCYCPIPNILIRAGEIHTVTNGVIRNGEILISDGLIEQIGMSVNAPADAQEYWAEVVIPGMIDAQHTWRWIGLVAHGFLDPSHPNGGQSRTWISRIR